MPTVPLRSTINVEKGDGTLGLPNIFTEDGPGQYSQLFSKNPTGKFSVASSVEESNLYPFLDVLVPGVNLMNCEAAFYKLDGTEAVVEEFSLADQEVELIQLSYPDMLWPPESYNGLCCVVPYSEGDNFHLSSFMFWPFEIDETTVWAGWSIRITNGVIAVNHIDQSASSGLMELLFGDDPIASGGASAFNFGATINPDIIVGINADDGTVIYVNLQTLEISNAGILFPSNVGISPVGHTQSELILGFGYNDISSSGVFRASRNNNSSEDIILEGVTMANLGMYASEDYIWFLNASDTDVVLYRCELDFTAFDRINTNISSASLYDAPPLNNMPASIEGVS